MKKIIGFISVIILLCTTAISVISIWDLMPVNWELIKQIAISGLIVIGAFMCIWLCMYYFFSREKSYDMNQGNIAHPKKVRQL